jgi:nucleotide-binding universal stress UspA family protein
MFRKILVPVDGSRSCLRAVLRAIELARRFEGEITFFTVFNASALLPRLTDPEQGAALERSLRAAHSAALGEAASVALQSRVPTLTKEAEGDPAYRIAREAIDGSYDLIVMSSRGLTLSESDLQTLGSVADRVLRMVACSVLVIKE